jgi:hypothetical protein
MWIIIIIIIIIICCCCYFYYCYCAKCKYCKRVFILFLAVFHYFSFMLPFSPCILWLIYLNLNSFQPVLCANVPLIFCIQTVCGCWLGMFISSSVLKSDGMISAVETALNLFSLLLLVLFFVLYSTLCICVVFVNLYWLFNWHLCWSVSTSIRKKSNWTNPTDH